jgi:hypothetical protein
LLTGDTVFATVFLHTVNKKEQQHGKTLQMKTKTLLIAAAALAAGVISSQAQVYSQNIVGYVNAPFGQGINTLASTPLTTGNDVLTNVLIGVPAGTIVQFWDPVGGAFSTALTFSGPPSNRHWKDGNNVNQDNYSLAPGIGYFVNAGAAFTNTYVGSVVVNSGASATNVITSGGVNYLVGSLLPFGDYVTNTSTVNLVPPAGTIVQVWNTGSQSFSPFTYSGPPSNRTWKDVNNNVNPPLISVGQGFFINGGQPYNWVQTLQ